MRKYFKKRGFTLVELLVVIAIIAIIFIVLLSKVDFATDNAKETGVKTDFKSFQMAFETLFREGIDNKEDNVNKNLDKRLKISSGFSLGKDPWGEKYVIDIATDKITAKSKGRDRKDTSDDYSLTVTRTWTKTKGFPTNLEKGEIVEAELPDGITVTSVSVTNPVIGYDIEGKVVFSLSDSTTKEFNAYDAEITGYNKIGFDNQTITVTVGEYSAISTIKTQKHTEQTTSSLVAYGTDLKAVNLDLWEYNIIDTASMYEGVVGTYVLNEYKGDKSKNEIQGYMPVKINNIIVTSTSNTFGSYTSLTIAPVIPDSVVSMRNTFFGCTSLTEAPIIPDSVRYIEATFYNCNSLTIPPVIPSNVSYMYRTFVNCISLSTPPVIPNSVTNMNSTFYKCKSLTTPPVIPNSVTTINDILGYCSSLITAPEIPNSVTTMYNAFEYCTLLKTAPVIPINVNNINCAFIGCKALTGTIVIDSNASIYDGCFINTSTNSDANLVVTGSSKKLDKIIATKSASSHITKG